MLASSIPSRFIILITIIHTTMAAGGVLTTIILTGVMVMDRDMPTIRASINGETTDTRN